MNIVYKYPLHTSKTTAEILRLWSCSCRYLWNRMLRLSTGLYKRYKINFGFYGKQGTNHRLTTLRKRYDWLEAIPNCCQQYILMDLDKAFKNFFRRVKLGETPGYPRFKHRGLLPRLYFPRQRFSIFVNEERHYLVLTKVRQPIRINVDRPYLNHPNDQIISVSLVFDRIWYACLLIDTPDPVPVKRDLPPVGINRGVINTVALSDGGVYQIDNEKLKSLEQRKAVLQRRLSRKVGSKKGQPKSGHWLRLKNTISNIDHKVADIRRNFNHQTSRSLVDNYSHIAMEKYDIKKMTESASGTVENPGRNVQVKSMFNRMILRNAWGQLCTMIKYKGKWIGTTVDQVDIPYITQQCSECDYIHINNVNKNKRLFHCGNCGYTNDLDKNAAKNVLRRSIQNTPAGSPG